MSNFFYWLCYLKSYSGLKIAKVFEHVEAVKKLLDPLKKNVFFSSICMACCIISITGASMSTQRGKLRIKIQALSKSGMNQIQIAIFLNISRTTVNMLVLKWSTETKDKKRSGWPTKITLRSKLCKKQVIKDNIAGVGKVKKNWIFPTDFIATVNGDY